MKFAVPWSVKGIRLEARETAKEAARRSGMSLGDWLNSVILHQAAEDGLAAAHDDDDDDDDDDAGGHELSSVHQRLDELTRRIEQFGRTGPAAYAPKNKRNEDNQIAELIGRLDRRLDQFVNSAPVAAAPARMPAAAAPRMPAGLDLAVAEIAARQRALNGQPPTNEAPQQRPQAAAPQPSPMLAPVPTQDLSGLEDQLRKITNQIETLRRPGVEEAINALRDELSEIGHAMTEAMPRQAIETIERQIKGLNQRIADGREAGVDGRALSGVEHGLAEVRDALRSLTPAENLVGFNDAVAGLAHKIDLIVAQKDPETLHQLENAITTLRDMATHVASTDAVSGLAAQVSALADKVDHMSLSASGNDAINSLEQRISALSDALNERAQNGGTVPPMLDALVQSLSDKIEMIQQSRGDNVAVGHLEDRIVSLVQRLDASDSRLGHLEAIERGLADLLVHIEEMRANKEGGALRADNSAGVGDLKQDIARTQDALEAVHGTLGHVVDRLVLIEKDIRGETRKPIISDEQEALLRQPIGKVAARMINEPQPASQPVAVIPVPAPLPPVAAPPPPPRQAPRQTSQPAPQQAPQAQAAAPAQKRLPPASNLPIDPDLPPDQPLEPGSGPPAFRGTPAARIAAAEAALGSAFGSPPASAAPAAPTPPPAPAAPSSLGKSGFIAAARRAAQAAVQAPVDRAPPPPDDEPFEIEFDESEPPPPQPLRAKLMKRVKSLFIAASIAGVVVGSIQIAGNFFQFAKPENRVEQTAKDPVDAALDSALNGGNEPNKISTTAPNASSGETPQPPLSVATNPLALPKPPATPLFAPITGNPIAAPSVPLENPTTQSLPSLLNPPVLNNQATGSTSDVTGSIAKPGPARPPTMAPGSDRLPVSIGGPRLRSAAVAGDGAAAYEVGVRFADGRGVPASLEDAAVWFERAAGRGLAPAQFRYASLLEKGQGVKKDLTQARKLYLAAAAKGNGKAMHNLAVLYAEGVDGKPDYATAAQWFRKASLQGIADSQYNLGVLCARGLGTEKSLTESYKWFALAAVQGDRESAKKRDEIASRMDADDLAAAQDDVKKFVAERQPEDAVAVPEPPGGWDSVTTTTPPRAKPRVAAPLSLGSFEIGRQ